MVVVAVVLFLYAVITESLDWFGRMDLIAQHWPKLGAVAESRRLRILVVLVGIALLVRVLTESRPTSSPSKETAKSSVAESLKPDSAPDTPGGAPQTPPSFGTQMVLADGRVVISCGLEDLQAAFHNNTTEQFNRLLSGRWIKTSGRIEDNEGNGTVYLRTPGSPLIVLQFAKGWTEQLSAMPRGAPVTIRGRMARATGGGYVRLEECELL